MAYTCKLGSSLGTSTTFSSGTSYSSVRFKCSVNLGTVSGYITFYGDHDHSSTVKNTITINNSSGTLSSPGSVSIYVSNFDTSKEHTFSITKTSTSYTVTLTADFEPLTGTITYDKNGGTGGPSSGATTIGNYYTIPSSHPTRNGYNFIDWESDETGRNYDPGDRTLVYASESDFPYWPDVPPILYNDTLVAQWEKIVEYTVSYSPGDGGGSIAPSVVQSGKTLTLSSGISFSKTGYTLKSWSGSDGNNYNLGQTITVTQNLILTAVWEINNYDIFFYDRKDATATTPFVKENYPYNTSIDLTDKRGFSFPGYNFLGWVEPSDFNKIIDSYNIKADNNQALYAIWELGSNIHIYTNQNWQIAIPYIYENGEWKLSISKVFNNGKWRQ